MAELILASEVRAYLVAQNAVTAAEAGLVTRPPCWVDPREGAPEPASFADADAVVTLLTGLEIAPPVMENFRQERVLEVVVRAYSRPRAELVQRQIRGLLAGKRLITMGQLLVQQSELWRGVQVLAADEASWTLTQSFRIDARVVSLTV